eukprot:Em0019g426a
MDEYIARDVEYQGGSRVMMQLCCVITTGTLCRGRLRTFRHRDLTNSKQRETVDKRRESSRGSCSPSKRPLLGGEYVPF